jgi:hypothetical protein
LISPGTADCSVISVAIFVSPQWEFVLAVLG